MKKNKIEEIETLDDTKTLEVLKEEKEVKEKNNNKKYNKFLIIGLVILIIVICIGLFLGLGLLIGDKVSDKEPEVNENVVIETVDLDINSGHVLNAYSYIPSVDSSIVRESAYRSYETNMTNVDNGYLLANLYPYVKSKLNKENVTLIEGEFNEDTLNKGKYSFSSDIMHDAMKVFYGDLIKDDEFKIGEEIVVTYNSDDNSYSYQYGGYTKEYNSNIRVIDKAYEDDEYMYIEDYYIYFTYSKIDDKQEYHLYKESDKVNEVEITSDFKDLSAQEVLDTIAVEYLDKMDKYEHKFKKNDDGTVYWVSSHKM